MLKKCVYYVRGMIKTWALVVLLVAMVGYYFWHSQVDSFVAGRIETSSKNGAIFYANGIWSKVMDSGKLQGNSNSRTMELLGNTKKVSDKSGAYSFEIPETWEVVDQQGAVGKQLSKITVESSNFSEHSDGSQTSYDSGGQLTVESIRGEQPNAKLPDGGYGKNVIRKVDADIGGTGMSYYVISDQNVENADVVVANVIRDGNTYNIRFVYNKRLDGGEFSYQEILHSFKFTENK